MTIAILAMWFAFRERARKPLPDNSIPQLLAQGVLRKAQREDYVKFLEGYVAKEGRPTSWLRGTFSTYEDKTYVAERGSFTLPPLYGAAAVRIIVKPGVAVSDGGRGHSELLFMEGFRADPRAVQVYEDTIVPGLRSRDAMLRDLRGVADGAEWNRCLTALLSAGESRIDRARVFVPLRSFELLPMHGASAVTVCTPPGIEVVQKEEGHNVVVAME